MATLILSAVGTMLGGPLGGAIGALVGQQVDRSIIGSPKREGPRIKELAVSTSSYGTAIPRVYGRLRAPGSIVWSTDLIESSETASSGKGQPSITSYSYAISFAVVLSSRPILSLGRIWADGNLLRGAAGDLKTGGTLRIYDGHGDYGPDPLIASDKGAHAPAFRGLAYVVFEDLQLADFGNRIPALTFEIVSDEGEVSLIDLLDSLDQPPTVDRPLNALGGFSLDGGPLAQTLASVDAVYPMALDAGGSALSFTSADPIVADAILLPEAAAVLQGDSFASQSGSARLRDAGQGTVPDSLRYYDIDRDFQAGLQRADGQARPGRGQTIEFPGALAASDARQLANAAARRAGSGRDSMSWRLAELDTRFSPGTIVRAPGHAGNWRIDAWEWRDTGIELELRRVPHGPGKQPVADAGTALAKPDLQAGTTALFAFELPWDGTGDATSPRLHAAVSSASAGWKGAALYADNGGALSPLGSSGSRRAAIGQTTSALPPSASVLADLAAWIDVQLVGSDLVLGSAALADLASGTNRALIGDEVIQFAKAEQLGPGSWRLTGLLRGRGGTDAAALLAHPAGSPFVLLDHRPVLLDSALIPAGGNVSISAIGVGDAQPATAPLTNRGVTLRPPCPVHASARVQPDNGLLLSWTRRARGAWYWQDGVDVPLVEQAERYRVGLAPVDAPLLFWETGEPQLLIGPASRADLVAAHPGGAIWVRQIGDHALSNPLLLTQLS